MFRRLAILTTAVLTIAAVSPRAQVAGPTQGGDSAHPNFDIRDYKSYPRQDEMAGAADYVVKFAAPERVATLRDARLDAALRLSAVVPGVRIEDHATLHVTEVVSAGPGGPLLTAPGVDRVSTLRQFLGRQSAVYGLSPAAVADLAVVADYVNPAGNMAWVELEQRLNGIPVFQGRVRGGFTAKGALVATTGILAAGAVPQELTDTPAVAAEQAVARAATLVGWAVTEPALSRTSTAGGKVTLAGPGMAGDASAWLVYFPLAPGVLRLAWATQIIGDPDAFLTVIDADDSTVLFRKNLTEYQTQAATYTVYTSDSPAPDSPTTSLPGSGTQAPFVARAAQVLVGNEGVNAFNTLGWIKDGNTTTDGNNVEAGLDVDGVNGVDAPVTGPGRVFTFAYDPAVDAPTGLAYRNGEVTNMFYWVNRYHDLTYLLGFTEGAGNFQADNFGRGGTGNDRISAETQDTSGTNNANFATPADGGRGRMQMFVWTGPTPDRSGGLDQDVVFHELTHGLSNRLHANAAGLSTNMARGMGEGWSDFYARALLAAPSDDPNGIYSVGGWATHQLSPGFTDNYYYGIRRFPYAPRSNLGVNGRPHSPLTFADIDSTKASLTDGAFPRGPNGDAVVLDQVHNIGEVWAGMLWEVRARLIARLGFAGNQRLLQFVTDGMKLDPAAPTMLQARDAILAAATASGTTADVVDIWAGFATRGLGVSAQITNVGTGANNTRVVEAFDVPGVAATTATLASESIPNGHLDPAEFAGLAMCVTNQGASTSGALTGALLASGGISLPSPAQSFGTLAPGASACRTFTFTVGASCGLSVAPSLQMGESGGGTRLLTYAPLEVGAVSPVLTQSFDGVVAPALPGGWTSSTLSGAANPWVTNTLSPDSAPNRAFAVNAAAVSDNALTSPAVLLGAGINRVTFRHNYNTEATYDGGVLEIAIGAGAFQDVSIAGGSFLTGGYTGTINATFSNPIGGRQAWTGNSNGYVTTTVTLPAAAAGQSVRLRWRMASDLSVAGQGWAVDGIVVGGIACGGVAIVPPVAVNDSYGTAIDTALSVPAAGVLANDTGAGPLSAAVASNPAHGTVALNSNGSFVYTPAPGYIGLDSFTYRASNAGGPSTPATVSLTVTGPTSVQPPTGLRISSLVGNVVTLRWNAPALGPVASGYVLEAGVTPGSVIGTLPLGPLPSLTLTVPNGSFYLRLRSTGAGGPSAVSNEIALNVGVPVPPSAPANLLGTVAGDTVTLAWTNTFAGAEPTGLVVDVTGAATGSLPIAVADTFSVGPVPPGTYTFRLRATNGAGASSPSNAVTLTFPGACTGAPLPPANFLAFTSGNVLSLAWDTAASGAAPGSFLLGVTGSFSGSAPLTGRGLTTAVPSGTYNLTLQAVNACGVSAPTAVQTVTVP